MKNTPLDVVDDNKIIHVNYRNLVVIVVFLAAINILLHLNLPNFDRPFAEKVYFAVLAYPFFIPTLGFALGLLVALIPYRALPFRAKYLRAALITTAVFQFVMMVAEASRYM